MITFNWTIPAVERAVSLDGLSDVIQNIHWRYCATDENGITSEVYGVTTIGEPNPEDFTPYNDVTTSDVEGWLESILGSIPETLPGEETQISKLDRMKTDLEEQIALLISPTTILGPLFSSSPHII